MARQNPKQQNNTKKEEITGKAQGGIYPEQNIKKKNFGQPGSDLEKKLGRPDFAKHWGPKKLVLFCEKKLSAWAVKHGSDTWKPNCLRGGRKKN